MRIGTYQRIFHQTNHQVRLISNQACFGGGCFWGVEKYFKDEFANMHPESNIAGKVGYMGPKTAVVNPSYKDVCTGKTGHVEVYNFSFDGGPEMYEKLVRFFYRFHDPTTLNQQGNDRGTQYGSVIFCYDDEQKEIAHRVTKSLQTILSSSDENIYRGGDKVRTDVREATVFYAATEEHQEYLMKNPWGYCNHRLWFTWPDE
jgi:peptide-methionine (S)-S-oxide reductase